MNSNTAVHILLVEDDEVDARSVERGLASQHIANRMTRACEGAEALDHLRGVNGKSRLPRPYVILLDLNMPGMNGLEFLAEIRRDPELRQSVVFVLTTSDDDEDVVAAYGNGVAGYILKSEAGDDFIRVVQLLEKFVITIHFPNNGTSKG